MRGRRAFAILTIYLLLLAGFAFMVERLIERSYQGASAQSSAFASAAIGQGIFAALLMLMTLQVVFLAPSSTAGAISLEREKQTLDLLVATPIRRWRSWSASCSRRSSTSSCSSPRRCR